MSAEAVVSAVRGAGLPIARLAWPLGSAPELPWCVFRLDEDAKLNADGARWASYPRWAVELYQRSSDAGTERKLEEAISASFGDYDKREAWVEGESCFMTTYTFTDFERT